MTTTKCSGDKVRLAKAEAVRLLEWHGGQGSALYSLGSSSYVGRCVPLAIAEDALWELRKELGVRQPTSRHVAGEWRSGYHTTSKDQRHLVARIKAVAAAIRTAKGRK